MEIIRCEDLTKIYRSGTSGVHAVDGVSLSFEQGSFTAVTGKSGSGKSTLLHLLSGLDIISEEATGAAIPAFVKVGRQHDDCLLCGWGHRVLLIEPGSQMLIAFCVRNSGGDVVLQQRIIDLVFQY